MLACSRCRRRPAIRPPTSAIEGALAKAKVRQAGQPKGPDGLTAKTEVVLASTELAFDGDATP
jgi:hypothetical protein